MFQDTQPTGTGRVIRTAFSRRPHAVALQWGGRLAALGMACGLVLAAFSGRTLESSLSPAVADTLGAATPTVSVCFSAAPGSSHDCTAALNALPSSGRVTPAWVRPVSAGGAAITSSLIPAVLTLPHGWHAGDSAAVVVAEQPWAERWRTKLADELLADGAAVLELDVYTMRGVSADSAAAPPSPTPQDMLPDLFGALQLLAGEEFGAGGIFAFGVGVGGTAVILAARESVATHYSGSRGLRFAAAARLNDGCEWTATAAEAPVGWRAEALHFGTVLAAAGPWTSEPAQADAFEAASLTCAAALVLPASGRPRQSP